MQGFVLIAGTPFCGSTLLAMLLDSHPEIASISELQGPLLTDPRSYICSCQQTMVDCAFWSHVQIEMRKRGVDFSIDKWGFLFELGSHRVARHLLVRSLRSNALDNLRDGLLERVAMWRSPLREIGARNEAIVGSVLSITGKKIFVDGTKDPIRARFLERFTDLKPKVLHLVRDAPGSVSSHVKNNRESVNSGIRNWNRMAGHCTRLFAWLPEERSLRVRYEDLCTNPEHELNRFARFAGVESFPRSLDVSDAVHHIIGNRMRLKPLTEISLDETWKQRLTAGQIETILRRTVRYRRLFGYV
jgi:hypothetical protein